MAPSASKFRLRFSHIVGLCVVVTTLLAIACGASATSTPLANNTPTTPASGDNTPVASPTPTTLPDDVTIHPGKLTWMVAGWGAGRFSSGLAGTGTGNAYARIFHGFPIAAAPSGEMVPGIATDWEVSEDGLTWTVTLREGAKFHDGSEVTAEDVAWTWRHEWGPESLEYVVSTTSQAQARNTESIEVVGENQVAATLKSIDAGFPAGILSEAGPNWIGHILPARDTLYDPEADQAYDRNPIGAGPMKLIRQVPSELMAFERFEDYYYQPENGLPEDRRPKFTFLDLRLVPEESTRVAALQGGDADIVPASLTTRSQIESGGGRLVFGPEGVYMRPVMWGCWKPELPCSKKEVRHALAYALDKELIRDQLYGGEEVFQVKGWQFVTPSSIGYSPELDPFPYDPDRARELLAEAGYPGGEGFGTFVVNTWVSSAMPFVPEAAQVAANMWEQELGLDVEVRVGDEAVLNRASQTEELHGQMTWRDNEARYDGGSILRSSYGTPDQGNRLHDDPELFELVRNALAVVDPEARPAALNEVYVRLREEQREIGVGYVNIPWGVGPRVQTWEPFTFAFFPSGVHTITLR